MEAAILCSTPHQEVELVYVRVFRRFHSPSTPPLHISEFAPTRARKRPTPLAKMEPPELIECYKTTSRPVRALAFSPQNT